ncbi:acyl-CoA dehydrogenase family protein [Alicyclobacillus tolerans]|uniref:acyl-CoA dehydrogenase family protein n=1 Tax=Alicyclobacillus tolerans TaxID=90970 RepID=UPI001F3F7734|nr:acyl-CoA dehydrogenase family protein [Alicyclobacillus tolerans]MCF8565038.1 acyl-CoA dehydrogenase family protein [Alicyclobacillus tolerans]
MYLDFSEEQKAFRDAFHAWIQANLPDELKPEKLNALSHDDQFQLQLKWEQILAQGGWMGVSWPKEYGGMGKSIFEQVIYYEELAKCGAPAMANSLGHGIVGPTLMVYGTPEQRERFLPGILQGKEVWCQGYSEPNAGSDLASLNTRGVVDGDVLRITGQKVWTSYAHLSNWMFALVRTDSSAEKHKGITFVLIDMSSPGITVRPLRQITDESHFNEVFFEDVVVPVENVVGGIGNGWKMAMAAAAFERGVYFVRHQVELAQEAQMLLDVMDKHLDDPGRYLHVKEEILDNVEAMRWISYKNLSKVAAGEAPGSESSVTKLIWSETHQRIYETALEILGPEMVLGPHEKMTQDKGFWQKQFLYTRAETILAATSEIHRNLISERILGLPRG